MNARPRSHLLAALAAVAALTVLAGHRASGEDKKPGAPEAPAARTAAKPLGDAVRKGLDYLVKQQLPNGGWSQGEESQQMRGSGEPGAVANVGDTCIAALALVRAGNTPKEGPYARNVAQAVAFVCGQVEKSPKDDLYVTDVKNTRLQGKLGTYVDTFLTSMLLAEVKGKMGDDKGELMVLGALDQVVAKVAKNQQADGTWANAGWAPVLAQSLASKGLNRAAQNCVKIDEAVLARTEKNARDSFQPAGQPAPAGATAAGRTPAGLGGPVGGGGIAASGDGRVGVRMEGAANVPLYSFAANAAAGQDAVNTRKAAEADLRKVADDPKAPKADREKAEAKLKDNAQAAQAQEEANRAVVARLGDKAFVQGFGSNGGEEFLSYMQISETLLAKGGKEWQDWDKSMADNLTRIQNPDGSWSGHHCITGRTFCTATALLVLMADRAPLPAAAKK